jgi:hypothetical protein
MSRDTTTRKALGRARARGVDTMTIHPRPLRTPSRVQATRSSAEVRRAWEQAGNSIRSAMRSSQR